MTRLIKNLANNRKVVFDSGKFDNWCVYVVEVDGSRNAPSDTKYFSDLQKISSHYTGSKVYNDFVRIYEVTSRNIDESVLTLIEEIAETYSDSDKKIMEQWFTVIYAGMIAEENKAYTKLSKRVKRLGMYQTLVLNMPATEAANYSRGKKWRELNATMQKYGF
jgi:hypothetical protein